MVAFTTATDGTVLGVSFKTKLAYNVGNDYDIMVILIRLRLSCLFVKVNIDFFKTKLSIIYFLINQFS